MEGIVLRIDRQQRTMTVSHREVPGYMPAMAMPFQVGNAGELRDLSPGARVAFRLTVRPGAPLRASHVRLVRSAPLDVPVPQSARRIAIGERVPDFALLDQDGTVVRVADFRGRVVAIDFIYTRCPLPDVCPRLSANFAALQRGVPGLSLLSVTLDPEYDRPAVLAEYGRRWGADPNRWHLLTGTSQEVRTVAGYFGLQFFAEEGMVTHTVSTAVVDGEGRLRALIDTPSYRWEQLRDLVLEFAGAK